MKTKPESRLNLRGDLASGRLRRPSHRPLKPIGAKRPAWHHALLAAGAALAAMMIIIISWNLLNLSAASGQLFGNRNLLSFAGSSHLTGAERGRANILLIGYSRDDPGHPGSKLTDSLILLSLATKGGPSYMLSIPRDLYVRIPHFGHAKINEAYQNGGPTLLKRVVSRNFKTPIDRHIIVNYSAVRDIVDALDGIKVRVNSPDKRGLYDPNINKTDGGPLRLTNGWHVLNGQTALNYTRARGDHYKAYGFPASDFDRAKHQRQVFDAIRRRLGWQLVLQPWLSGRLLQAATDNLKTNLRNSEMRGLLSLIGQPMKSLSLDKLNRQNLLTSYATSTGASALIPAAGLDDFSQIQAALQKIDQ